jgi:methyltransferase (TIGR00027 family)
MQHMRVDCPPPILDDPLAELLLGDDAEQLLGLLGSLPEEVALALRAAITARCRVAEDRARVAAGSGPARYVLLGAGLDSAAWRLGELDLEIVEIDRPDVLDDKRARATAAELSLPHAVRYLPADLATEPVGELLGRALDGGPRRTVIAWCGVTQYLPPDAVLATLQAVATLPPATELVFTTFLPDERVPEDLRSGGRQIAELAAAAGEPFLTRLAPEDTAALVSEAGLKLIADMGVEELGTLFEGRSDDLAPVEAEHVVIAAVS